MTEHPESCSCCGAVSEWFAIWRGDRHLGVRLKSRSRDREHLMRDVLSAVVESHLILKSESQQIIVVHADECPIATDHCTCGPAAFVRREDAVSAGYWKEGQAH